MADAYAIDKAVRDAQSAERLLTDPLLNEALKQTETAYLESLLSCDHKDDLGRFRFAEAIKTVRSVRSHLHSLVESGKLDAHTLKQLNGKRGFF